MSMTLEEKYNLLKDNKYFEYFSIKEEYERRELSREELMSIWKKEEEVRKPYMIPYENPFMHIRHFEEKYFNYFSESDDIIIQEKIDGSNSHVNVSSDGFKVFGNNYELNSVNHLNGLWYYMKDNYMNIPEKYHHLDIYGEWLTPHHCDYPGERYGLFYVFDVMENGEYWTQDRVERLAKECGFCYAPVLYCGKFKGWKHVRDYVGKTLLGGKQGEGIVLKNQTKLNINNLLFYVKIVSPEYQEFLAQREKVKIFNMDKVLEMEELRDLAKSVVTENRVRKILFKLVDNGEISSNWKNIGNEQFSKKLCSAVYKDCLTEEPEIVSKVGKMFGKYNKDFVMLCLDELKK